jgi:predicted site-specific integrase-resolvase
MNRFDNPDPLRSLKQGAQFLGIATDTLRRYAKVSGKIRFFQVGRLGHLKFRQSELERFLLQHSKSVVNG